MIETKFTIIGEPASKANSRKFVFNRKTNKPMFIKSDKARAYEKTFKQQCPTLNPLIEHDVEVIIEIFYASRRPDLDESLILDLMQDRIYKNDRQVKKKIIKWGLDKDNPHSVIQINKYI